ncbi:MAG: hypothetical protein Q4E05_10325 [Pseudoclavibacter sp.]|nr:hypothetical protein [Pseudoclavibacter sp.]
MVRAEAASKPPRPAGRDARALGLAAIAAAWLVYLSDLAIGIFDMFGDAFWVHLPELAPWRVSAAAFALFLFPLLAAGALLLRPGLRAGWLCATMAYLFCTVCVFLHSSYFFFARTAVRLSEARDEAERAALTRLLAEYSGFKDLFGAIYLGLALFVSLSVLVLVLLGRTAYPRWFAAVTPLTGVPLSLLARAAGPEAQEALRPVTIPAFWLALMFTLYLLVLLFPRSRTRPAAAA